MNQRMCIFCGKHPSYIMVKGKPHKTFSCHRALSAHFNLQIRVRAMAKTAALMRAEKKKKECIQQTAASA